MSCEFESHFLHVVQIFAEIAQLVEHNLAKVRVASSSLVFRSRYKKGQYVVHTGLFSYCSRSCHTCGIILQSCLIL